MSSDAVYASNRGNYKETDILKPYKFYGFTKAIGEKIVQKLEDFIIIRTRFFDKKKILFNYSARNIYTSSIEVEVLVKYIFKLIKFNYKGIVNVGVPKISDYNNYKKYKKNLKACDKNKVFKEVDFKLASNAALNIAKLKKILSKYDNS